MKKNLLKLFTIAALAGSVSCAAGPNAQTGAVIGGLAGAGVGAIAGHQSGRALEGAAIGAGVGAIGGGVIGNAQDQRNERNARYYREAPPPRYYDGY